MNVTPTIPKLLVMLAGGYVAKTCFTAVSTLPVFLHLLNSKNCLLRPKRNERNAHFRSGLLFFSFGNVVFACLRTLSRTPPTPANTDKHTRARIIRTRRPHEKRSLPVFWIRGTGEVACVVCPEFRFYILRLRPAIGGVLARFCFRLYAEISN